MQRGMCANYHGCSRFEYVVACTEGDRCGSCGHLLLHESGLTWEDARAKGYLSAFRDAGMTERGRG